MEPVYRIGCMDMGPDSNRSMGTEQIRFFDKTDSCQGILPRSGKTPPFYGELTKSPYDRQPVLSKRFYSLNA